MAIMTQRPPMTPTSTQGNISQRVSPSDFCTESALEKKLVRQFDLAVECLERDRIIQARATENAAVVTKECKVTYLRKRMDFSYNLR
jgi:hypothetical protein